MLIQMPRLGLDPRLLRDGVARPARPGRVLGRVPGASCRPTARASGSAEPLFRTLMVIAAVGTVLAAAYLLWLYQRTAFGEPTAEFAGRRRRHDARGHGRAPRAQRRRTTTTTTTHDDIHDVEPHRVDRLDAVPDRHRRVRRLPAADVQGHRSGRDAAGRPPRGRHSVNDRSSAPRPSDRLDVADDRLARARARDLIADRRHQPGAGDRPAGRGAKKWAIATLAGFVLLGAFIPVVTLAVIGDDVAVDVRRAVRGRRLLARSSRRCSCSPATSSCC